METIQAKQDSQKQLERLQKAREKVDTLNQEKSRITGELGALQTQIEAMETKCQTEFGCAISDLPDLIERLKTEAEAALVNAEIILGLREGKVSLPPPASNAVDVKKTKTVDEDGLL